MPYNIRWEEHGVYKSFYGHLSASEFQKSIYELHTNERSNAIHYVINDLLSVEEFQGTAEEVEAFSNFAMGAFVLNPNVIIAVIVNNDEILSLAKAKAAPSFSRNQLAFFPKINEARTWIEEHRHVEKW